ncbi:hypothetical protein AeMF1_017411 [Aphanomyces euteiches]|nr:hypothetical protein AeMF1_017411 [Aphanomyces euteiches]
MRLSMESRTKKSTGDICNLYTTDVGNILMAAYYINEIWILPTVICIALVMLYRVVGMAAFAGFSVIVFVLVVNQFIARIMANIFEKLMEIKDERMKNINELFGAIQIVKWVTRGNPNFSRKLPLSEPKNFKWFGLIYMLAL